jgi:hypothetical protein
LGKLKVLLVASALLTAACGAAATPSSSSTHPASIAGVRVNGGPNANSDVSDITNRPNPPTHPGGGSTQTKPPVPAAVVAPPASPVSHGGAWDRCGGGIGVDLGGSRAGSPGQKRPVPECNVE